jgi:hypothetical protein
MCPMKNERKHRTAVVGHSQKPPPVFFECNMPNYLGCGRKSGFLRASGIRTTSQAKVAVRAPNGGDRRTSPRENPLVRLNDWARSNDLCDFAYWLVRHQSHFSAPVQKTSGKFERTVDLQIRLHHGRARVIRPLRA